MLVFFSGSGCWPPKFVWARRLMERIKREGGRFKDAVLRAGKYETHSLWRTLCRTRCHKWRRIVGKWALITGASAGIGVALAEELASANKARC